MDRDREILFATPPDDIELGLPKSCYYNCFQLLKDDFDLTYCEGYALDPNLVLPLIHAWLIDSDGKVIDPTWHEPDTVYLGIPFNTKWSIELLQSRNREDCLARVASRCFESNYRLGFSLLKEGLPNNAIADNKSTA